MTRVSQGLAILAILMPCGARAEWHVDRSIDPDSAEPRIVASTATEQPQAARLSVRCLSGTAETSVAIAAAPISGSAARVEYRFGTGVWYTEQWQVDPDGKSVSVKDAKAKALALIIAEATAFTVRIQPNGAAVREHAFRVTGIDPALREIRLLCRW